MEDDGAAMYIFYSAGFEVFDQEGNNPSTEIIVRHSRAEAAELSSTDRGACLDAPGFGFTFTTGIGGSLPCKCRPTSGNGIQRLNCDATAA